MQPLAITHFTATSALGAGAAAHLQGMRANVCALVPCRFETAQLQTYVGEVAQLEPLPPAFADFDARNNQLAALGVAQDGFAAAVADVVARVGATRVGLLLGTSTSGILDTEIAYRSRDAATGALPPTFRYAERHSTYSVARFLRRYLALNGPASVISTACSSSAKVFAAAARLIQAGIIDAAVVGGVDSLCLTTLYGFNSLQLTSPQPCRPYDAARDGISIGEAAAFALLQRVDDAPRSHLRLLGCGESSDAHHMSAPHPEGLGARLAMEAALRDAALAPRDIDYLNLHGTGTPSNDLSEGCAVMALFGNRLPCSSTKGATGHALGAAGALEAVLCLLALQNDLMPGGVNFAHLDPQLDLAYCSEAREAPLRTVMSNSFGFGGSNCALVLGGRPQT